MPNSITPSVSNLKRAIEIAEQIERLQAQLAQLIGGSAAVSPAPAAVASVARRGRGGKRILSPEARARIAAAQRERWAKARGGAKPAPVSGAAKPAKRKGLTPAGRARLAAAMKARWAARRKGALAPNAAKR